MPVPASSGVWSLGGLGLGGLFRGFRVLVLGLRVWGLGFSLKFKGLGV